MNILTLLLNTILLRPYVFIFLAAFLFSADCCWDGAGPFFTISWITAFLCEFSSTRIGIPFGSYYYTGSTVGQELYLFNVPFMDSLSFTFLLYASYCMALLFVLPIQHDADGASDRSTAIPIPASTSGSPSKILPDGRSLNSWRSRVIVSPIARYHRGLMPFLPTPRSQTRCCWAAASTMGS